MTRLNGSWRLVVSDIEGCLVPVGRRPWDLPALMEVARYVRAAAAGTVPTLTLASGRPAQFVEAVAAALGIREPVICENGGVLFDPRDGRVTPLFHREQEEALHEAGRRLEKSLAEEPWARLAQGKRICLSVIPATAAGGAGGDPTALYDRVCAVLATGGDDLLDNLSVSVSSSAVDVTPRGIDKGTGLMALLEHYGVREAEVVAVGDGGNDLPMMARAGLAAAPANALAAVRRAVAITAAAPETRGVMEILDRLTGFFTAGGRSPDGRSPAGAGPAPGG